jgi:dolichyl-phosphate beta-glucosyltransferase
MDLSIVIPAYNEEKRISSTVDKICAYLSKKGHNYEILIVDDGSKDKTAHVANSLIKKHECPISLLLNKVNRGKGHSVRKGMLAARHSRVLFTDADLSTPIEELEKFLPHLENDVVIGSRRLEDSSIEIRQPWYRGIPGAVFPFIVNSMVINGIRDTQCGFKLFKRDVARTLFSKQQVKGFSFDAEILFLARQHGYSVKEVGVVWNNDLDSRLNPVKHSYTMFMELLKIRINHLKGLYR